MVECGRWLIDRSALRPGVPAFAGFLMRRIAAGRVSVCWVAELEVGCSARSLDDHRQVLHGSWPPCPGRGAGRGGVTFSRGADELIARGRHRGVALPDLVVAAVAEVEGLVVVHDDRDVDLIAEVTGQPVERVVPAGTAPA